MRAHVESFDDNKTRNGAAVPRDRPLLPRASLGESIRFIQIRRFEVVGALPCAPAIAPCVGFVETAFLTSNRPPVSDDPGAPRFRGGFYRKRSPAAAKPKSARAL
jgi:hypothetical protein